MTKSQIVVVVTFGNSRDNDFYLSLGNFLFEKKVRLEKALKLYKIKSVLQWKLTVNIGIILMIFVEQTLVSLCKK